jgi:phytoene desaturase
MLPGLEDELVTSRMLTPQGFLDDYRAFKGAAFSVQRSAFSLEEP